MLEGGKPEKVNLALNLQRLGNACVELESGCCGAAYCLQTDVGSSEGCICNNAFEAFKCCKRLENEVG